MTGAKQDYIDYRVKKSGEAYQDALILAQNGRWNACVNRLYYSIFYLNSALLYQKNIKAQTHKGVKTQFFLHFVKPGVISKASGKLYSHLFDWRQETDYGDFIDFNEETVQPLLSQVMELLEEIKQLMECSLSISHSGIQKPLCQTVLSPIANNSQNPYLSKTNQQ